MSMVEEFKKFALRGNVVDLAVGIVVGAAFGKIITSFVADIIMPPIGLLIGGVDFSDLVVVLKEASGEVAAVTINYGKFIQSLIDFLIIAAAIFMVVRAMNSLRRKKETPPAAAPVVTKEEALLAEIRDILKSK